MERMQKKNTVGFQFGRDCPMPTLKEAISFLSKDLKIKDTEVHSVYRDLSENAFFIKFTDDLALKETTQRLKATETFRYADGKVAEVHVAVADGFFRYVRVFNLPPEVMDEDIAKTLAKFGTVRQLVREKLPSELGFDAFSGTRGAHMEVKTEIPPALYIGHYKCRIFYEGLRNRCFVCKQEGHVKADCPARIKPQVPIQDNQGSSSNVHGATRYADVAKGLAVSTVTVSNVEKVQDDVMPVLERPRGLDQDKPEPKRQVKVTQPNMTVNLMDVSPLRSLSKSAPDDLSRGRTIERRRHNDGKMKDTCIKGVDVLQNLADRSRSRSKSKQK